jgi:hypothetical protein
VFPKVFALIVSSFLSACLQPTGPSQTLTGPAQNANGMALQTAEGPRLKRMRATLLKNTLAKTLNLNPQGMCLELGRLPCIDLVHKVSLGGMNAYGNAQYQYPETISVTSPISWDRVVLSACIQRAQIDLINPAGALIFKDLKLSPDGRLVRDAAIHAAMTRLYQRAFLRDPSSAELASLDQLYEDIYATQPIGAAVNWMSLSCYAVLSSTEAVFY